MLLKNIFLYFSIMLSLIIHFLKYEVERTPVTKLVIKYNEYTHILYF